MPFFADFAAIQSDLRRVYPTQVLQEMDVTALDAHLPHRRLLALFGEVARVQGANAVLETEIVRSHVLHVGRSGAPDWERLNREMPHAERISVLKRMEDGILYWNLLLSRVGPFWTGNWNIFQVRHGIPFPTVVERPSDAAWTAIIKRVREILAGYEFQEVPSSLLRGRVSWLRLSNDRTASRDSQTTVDDALFSEVY